MLNKTILVVDDEPYILRSLSFVLEREGFQVVTASEGEGALSKIRELRPQLVFLDIMLPRKNGYEVCAAVKEDPELADTHVVMLSAKGQQIDRERGMLGGADEYMTKPFSPKEIVEYVQNVTY
ncbi:MAG: response regulator [Caldilineaceae bacterium]|nr:response regulator [Caldilineaceae bacterium]HRJ40733.1 response regulator [Caldilineaceae bacterium]